MAKMTPNALFDRLTEVAALLEEQYEATVDNLRKSNPQVDPLTVITLNGDPILAPLLAAIGQTLSAAAHMYLSGDVLTGEFAEGGNVYPLDAPQPKTDVVTHEPTPTGADRHLAVSPFVALCGHDVTDEMVSEFTYDMVRVTCPDCIRARDAAYRASQA